MHSYSITIQHISIAPEHQVFGKKNGTLRGDDLLSLERAKLIADSGIEGDRFCKYRPDYNGHITFFSLEVWNTLQRELSLSKTYGPQQTRRNVIVSGIDLKALYGKAFSIEGIRFLGTVHCAPCLAMNKVFGPGARAALQSLGGLRAQIKSTGSLTVGACTLNTEVAFDPKNAAAREAPPQLP